MDPHGNDVFGEAGDPRDLLRWQIFSVAQEDDVAVRFVQSVDPFPDTSDLGLRDRLFFSAVVVRNGEPLIIDQAIERHSLFLSIHINDKVVSSPKKKWFPFSYDPTALAVIPCTREGLLREVSGCLAVRYLHGEESKDRGPVLIVRLEKILLSLLLRRILHRFLTGDVGRVTCICKQTHFRAEGPETVGSTAYHTILSSILHFSSHWAYGKPMYTESSYFAEGLFPLHY